MFDRIPWLCYCQWCFSPKGIKFPRQIFPNEINKSRAREQCKSSGREENIRRQKVRSWVSPIVPAKRQISGARDSSNIPAKMQHIKEAGNPPSAHVARHRVPRDCTTFWLRSIASRSFVSSWDSS